MLELTTASLMVSWIRSTHGLVGLVFSGHSCDDVSGCVVRITGAPPRKISKLHREWSDLAQHYNFKGWPLSLTICLI